jgi:hypothetical protein
MRCSADEIAAGQTVPLGPVLDDLLATADRLEGELAKRTRGTSDGENP